MAIDSVSPIAPIMAPSPPPQPDQPPDIAADAQASGKPRDDLQPIASAISAESVVYMPGAAPISTSVSAGALDVEGSLREAVARISRAAQSEGPMPVDISAAAQSYTAEAEAQGGLVVPKQGDSTRALNVLA
jgi:hypothetical protein